MTAPLGAMPSPPFPDPESAVLKLIVENAIDAMNSGEATPEMAILHAAVHGWYEGHTSRARTPAQAATFAAVYRCSRDLDTPGGPDLTRRGGGHHAWRT